ncbi:hypothetical protein GCM10011363_44170 [Marivita lacus]|uniref:Uncharacterized protein n=1 Tax=Marivita lacus TaxID=1323742 RepID=A0ABQ1LHG9_9RHOB|nr:hypothetical protein GCM10011363_44170 [Marivita lacus]
MRDGGAASTGSAGAWSGSGGTTTGCVTARTLATSMPRGRASVGRRNDRVVLEGRNIRMKIPQQEPRHPGLTL